MVLVCSSLKEGDRVWLVHCFSGLRDVSGVRKRSKMAALEVFTADLTNKKGEVTHVTADQVSW
jgi:hypothetical protein